MQFGVEGVQLGLQGRFALAELWGACTELFKGDELFLVAVDEASERALCASQVTLQRVTTCRGGVRGAERLKPSVDLSFDQCRVLEEAKDSVPDKLVDLCQAQRPILTDTTFRPAMSVGA